MPAFSRICSLMMVMIFSVSACKPPSPSPPPAPQYEDKTLGFHFEVPQDWKINTATTHAEFKSSGDRVTFTTMGTMPNLDLFLTVDNRRANYRFEDDGLPLLPGEIYLSFAFERNLGFFGDPIVSDSVGGDLHPLLRSNDPPMPAPGPDQSVFELNFSKRISKWKVTVYLCPPIKPEDSKNLQALLQSFQFEDKPVGGSKWAISLAWEKLPPAIRAAGPDGGGKGGGWQIGGIYPASYTPPVEVTSNADGYTITFTQHTPALDHWQYSVSTDGVVRELSAPASPPGAAAPTSAR